MFVVFALDRSAQRVTQDQALTAVADPLAALCAQDATVRARVGAACGVAVQVVAEKQAIPAAGPMGPMGPAGKNGENGTTPPCLSTPAQCVGTPGKNGTDGKDGQDGAAGQTCEAPQVWASVTYGDGQTGTSCVNPPPPSEDS